MYRKTLITIILILISLPSPADIFIVDTLADFGAAEDANPGDGVCQTIDGDCTLRAAIQESNAYDGSDYILFDVTGTILVSNDIVPLGPLPAITDTTHISAPHVDPDGTIPADNPPQITLDGNQLTGSGNNYGLRFTPGGSDSSVYGIAIINFPDDGIRIDAAEGLNIGRNYIGMTPDGTPAGNGGHGISGLTDNGFFGKVRTPPFGELAGYGNLISANTEGGINILGSFNQFAGNFIGTDPEGISAHGNDGTGIAIAGTSNILGFGEFEQAENIISGNSGDGLSLGGSDSTVAGNRIGISRAGGPLGNAGNGIVAIGDNQTIGTSEEHGTNQIAGNGVSGVVGGIDGSLTHSVIQNNRLGVTVLSLGNESNGVSLGEATSVTIRNNQIINNGGNGIRLTNGATETLVTGNRIGFHTNVLGNHPQPNDTGIRIEGTDNTIGSDPPYNPNVIGFNDNFGISIIGSGNTVVGNLVGTTQDREPVGNGAAGISMQHAANDNQIGSAGAPNIVGFNLNGIMIYSATNTIENNFVGTDEDCADMGNDFLAIAINDQATNNTISSNTVAYSHGDGVIVDDPATFNSIHRNVMYANAGEAIDLDPAGATPNDPGDFDLGANYLMNYPEITILGYNMTNQSLLIELLVDSATVNAIYPLRIDFYWHDRDEPNQGQRYLGHAVYDAPQTAVTYELVFPEGTTGGTLRATATENDGTGNTSEMSPERMFGFFDPIFDDDFEEGDCPT